MSTSPPFKVKAVYDYTSSHGDDLSFVAGETITVTEEEDADWYIGEYLDASGQKQQGLFPRNFVERFEPEAPPRPTRRAKKDADAEPAPELSAVPTLEERPLQPAPTPVDAPKQVAALPRAPATTEQKDAPPAPKVEQAKPVPTATTKAPPPVSQKPATSSFKDRIAAFNKPAAPPIAPKPQAPPGGSSFIKKPFVAPPPSRNAYVPPPPRQDAPHKVYRREEDPEILERQKQDQESAEAAGLAGEDDQTARDAEEAPKATSLKDRIALLQKQQQEQAMRRSEQASGTKKTSPPEAEDEGDEDGDEDEADEEGRQMSRSSTEASREVPRPPAAARHVSKDPRPVETSSILSDGNDADESAAGNTTEDAGGDESTEVESEERPRAVAPAPLARTPTTISRGAESAREHVRQHETVNVRDEEEEDAENPDEAEEEEEPEIDPEVRRKQELRERMAKMSGGMGMPGMFGGIGMPMPGAAAKPRTSKSIERKSTKDSQDSARSPPPSERVPMVPIPSVPPRVTGEEAPTVSRETETEKPSLGHRAPGEIPDVEEVEPEATAAPPTPKGTPISRRRKSFLSESRRRPKSVSPHKNLKPEVGQPMATSYRKAEMLVLVRVPLRRPLPERAVPPPVPGSRPAPAEARGIPPPLPPARPSDPVRQELEAEEEMLNQGKELPPPPRTMPPLAGVPPPPPSRPEGPRSLPLHSSKRSSVTIPPPIPLSAPSDDTKRTNRAPPPIPGNAPIIDARPPPPPPPAAAPPSRRATQSDDLADIGDGESDYEGDYDTDIGSAVHHKDALKAHQKTPSADEATLSEEILSPQRPDIPTGPVPPSTSGATAISPPPPSQGSKSRQSMDAPRAVPPPPPVRSPTSEEDYDPYRYSGVSGAARNTHLDDDQVQQESDPVLYNRSGPAPPPPRQAPPPSLPQSPPPPIHAAPPPLPPQHQAPLGSSASAAQPSDYVPRQSLDVPRQSMSTRRSADQPRASGEQGPIARDIDLGHASMWWTRPNTAPPALSNRNDVLLEFEGSSASKRGGRTTISRDVYVLFQDYSTSTISARFDSKEPADASLEQQHQAGPARPSQDQLESFFEQFGKTVVSATNALSGTSVDDGSAIALIRKAFAAVPAALPPIGTRVFGALVYSNLGNASIHQSDEIRPGDIASFRNAKFSGKHGAMHAKYSMDVGEPEHVAVVSEWDGTKKKIRAWEQGRESKKVKVESFKLGDLKSGEVKIWRVVPRSFVGWEGES